VSDTTPQAVFTEDQHVALLASAVERETASITAEKSELEAQVASLTTEKASLETEKAELAARVDVIEAEKAAETAKAEAAEKALEDFKAELAEKAAVEQRKADRVAAVRAVASLDDEYFTDERAQRWAEMAEEAFTALVTDLEAAAKVNPFAKKNAADGDAEDKKDGGVDEAKEKARETAAFSGGTAPTAGQGTTLGQFFQKTGAAPATA